MVDYHMLYEQIVLSAWNKAFRQEDPYKLGEAGVLSAVDDNLSGQNGHEAKFGLSTAIRKVAEESPAPVKAILLKLDIQVWNAKKYNDICVILDKVKVIFESVGKVII